MEKKYDINYLGDLRCEALHIKSNTLIETDAPTDNNGKGEKFSPTDLVATALVTCILTVVGIHFEQEGRKISEIKCEVNKVMASNPRRIKEISIQFDFGSNSFSHDDLRIIEEKVHHCPVTESLAKDIIISTNLKQLFY
ncbi:OsmC family protein [Paracrocinitomix mangrovi]|uniref:OsmC family protein n=1 Tax=Paracrocinitomix mangrovi TaxID=2862509 RepID=UPI001C8DD418|nr:OsmC family protein [Paracrocinitomix mangrovi]UKN01728.1 OsmC family protein [Paracrocinitomix mangrovi]